MISAFGELKGQKRILNFQFLATGLTSLCSAQVHDWISDRFKCTYWDRLYLNFVTISLIFYTTYIISLQVNSI